MFRVLRFLPFCAMRGFLGPVVAVGAIVVALAYAASKHTESASANAK